MIWTTVQYLSDSGGAALVIDGGQAWKRLRNAYKASPETMALAKEMITRGENYVDTGMACGVSRSTVLYWHKRFGWASPRPIRRVVDRPLRFKQGTGEAVRRSCWIVLPHRQPDSPAPAVAHAVAKETLRRRCWHCDQVTLADPCSICSRPWQPAGLGVGR